MKIKVRAVTDVDFEFADPRVTLEMCKQIAVALESGWRAGAIKDNMVIQEIYRQQFGLTASISKPTIFFDFTYLPSEPPNPIGTGKTGP